MLKRRLIPKLLFTVVQSRFGPRPALVVTKNFSTRKVVGDPLSQAKIYESQLVDELLFLNIDSSPVTQNSVFVSVLQSIASSLSTPLTVGGGVSSLQDIELLLLNGADKVSINTHAHNDLKFVSQAASKFGAQCIVASVDYRFDHISNQHTIYLSGGSVPTRIDFVDHLRVLQSAGIGEIILTSIDQDGLGRGLDITTADSIRDVIYVPLILSGGCGLASHFVDGLEHGASGVAAGTYFTQRDQNPLQCRSQISNSGIPIRLEL